MQLLSARHGKTQSAAWDRQESLPGLHVSGQADARHRLVIAGVPVAGLRAEAAAVRSVDMQRLEPAR